MKRALLALAAAATLAAANGCGWQVQNMQGNQCTDGSCGACDPGAGRLGHGHLANRIRAGAQCGPSHVDGDFLATLKGIHDHAHGRGAANVDPAASPTVTYPYYTVRGPRDYFLNDPMPLGY